MSWQPSNDPVLGDPMSCDALDLVMVSRKGTGNDQSHALASKTSCSRSADDHEFCQ